MTKKEMLDKLLNEYFEIRDAWSSVTEFERNLRENGQIVEAERIHEYRLSYAQDCHTYQYIIQTLFDVDAFQLWLDK